MKRFNFLQSLLTLHLLGLVLMAGITMVDYVTFKTFWRMVDQEREKSMGLLKVMA